MTKPYAYRIHRAKLWTFREGDDDEGGGKQGKLDLDKGKGPTADDLAAKLVEQDKVIQKLQAEQNARADEERKKAEAERVKAGDAEKLLAEKDEALQAALARIGNFEGRETRRADDIFAGLPQSSQDRLLPLKAHLGPDAWAEHLAREAATLGANGGTPRQTPPPTGTPKPKGKDMSKHEPTTKAIEMLETMMRDDQMLRDLQLTQHVDEDTGQKISVFELPMRVLFAKMKKQVGEKVSLKKIG